MHIESNQVHDRLVQIIFIDTPCSVQTGINLRENFYIGKAL